jgi:hypothetical protein
MFFFFMYLEDKYGDFVIGGRNCVRRGMIFLLFYFFRPRLYISVVNMKF